jgi:hypothetical protein
VIGFAYFLIKHDVQTDVDGLKRYSSPTLKHEQHLKVKQINENLIQLYKDYPPYGDRRIRIDPT